MIKLKNIVNEDGFLDTKKPIGLSKIDPDVADAAIGGGHEDSNKVDDVVDGKKASIAVSNLKPAQKEIIKEKALGIAINLLLNGDWKNLDLGAIISNDNYIMDGHHRWAAVSIIDPKAKIEGTVIDLPGVSLVTTLNLITVGKLGITHGNKGTGDVSTFTGSQFQSIIENAIESGFNKFTAQQVKTALGKVPGANGDYNKGKLIVMKNADKLPKTIMPGAPSRVEMPVINADKVNMVKTMLQKGAVDLEMPYSPKVKTTIKQESIDIYIKDNKMKQNEGYTPGQGWSQDFAYEDMLQAGIDLKITDSLELMEKIVEDFTDVNYHREASNLYDAIDALKAGKQAEAKKYLKAFQEECQKTLDIIIRESAYMRERFTKLANLIESKK